MRLSQRLRCSASTPSIPQVLFTSIHLITILTSLISKCIFKLMLLASQYRDLNISHVYQGLCAIV